MRGLGDVNLRVADGGGEGVIHVGKSNVVVTTYGSRAGNLILRDGY